MSSNKEITILGDKYIQKTTARAIERPGIYIPKGSVIFVHKVAFLDGDDDLLVCYSDNFVLSINRKELEGV